MDETAIDLRGLLGVLRRQLRLIIGVVLTILIISGVVIFTLKPIYTASALLLVDTSRKNLLDPQSELMGTSSDSARVESEVELARAPTVLLRVVDDAKLIEDPEFAPAPGFTTQVLSFFRLRDYEPPTGAELLEATLTKLRNAVTVQRRGLTFVIAIQAQSGDPATAARIANAVARTYIAEQLEAKINSTLASRDIIQARISETSRAVADSEDAIDTFIGNNIAAIADETGRTDLEGLFAEVGTATRARAELTASLEHAGSSLRTRDWAALTKSLQSQALAELATRQAEVEASLQSAATDSQTAIDLRAELAAVENDLAIAAQFEIANLRTKVAATQGQVTDLRAKLRNDVLSSSLSSSTLTSIYELQQSSEIARSQYQTLLTRLKDLDQQAYLQVADSRIASEALPPDSPSFPNPRLLLALAGVAALVAALGLAFLYENFIGGIVSPEQLQALVKSRRVLTIPRQREQRGGLSLADRLIQAPLSLFSESVRKVRLAVDQGMRRDRNGDPSGRVVLVSSTAPSEGKSTTALSLARAYALSGATTLLIDCDLRKPSLHRHLGWEPSSGLIDYLGGHDTGGAPELQSIVKVDPSSSVCVLVGSRRSSGATDSLVAGPTFGRLIEAARTAFDIVILDTPPIGPVVDGAYLAQFADAIVFVVKWASTAQPDVRSAVATLSDAAPEGTEVTMVLNQSANADGKYAGKYAYYYSEI